MSDKYSAGSKGNSAGPQSSDKYIELVNSGFGKTLAARLGLPRPVRLRRHAPGDPFVSGPVLIVGRGAVADELAERLLGWDVEVRRHPLTAEKLAAIVVALDEVTRPEELAAPVMLVSDSLRDLSPHGRLITVSRPAASDAPPAESAARQGVDGLLRSLAHEMRGGSTANGILLAGGADGGSPSTLGALRFLLSRRSAFVDGQFLTVGSDHGSMPEDWERPLAGTVAVVTGAARGIGASIARTLHRDGATIVAVDVPAAGDALSAVTNEVRGTALQLDITHPEAGARIIEHAVSRHGRLDIVVHNAGITRDKLLVNMDEARWSSVIGVNLTAQLRMNEAFLASEHFREAPRIVSLSSTSGIAGNRGQTNYGASKAGIIGMARATAPALDGVGGTINAVAPGFIETEMTARIPYITREVARRLNSLQQGGLPVDVAEAVAFLSSPQAGGITGQYLRVCGQNLVGA